MKRVGTLALALTVCVLAATTTLAAEAKKVTWNLAMTWNSTLTPFVNAPMKVAQLVSEMTGGNFVIKIEGAEKHKAALEILDMVKGGQYQMGHSASYYWKGKDATTAILTTVPFGMNVQEQNAWLYYGGGLQLMQKVYDKFGVYALPGGCSPNSVSTSPISPPANSTPRLIAASSTPWSGWARAWILRWASTKSRPITIPAGMSLPPISSS